jgi:hypothetical protein
VTVRDAGDIGITTAEDEPFAFQLRMLEKGAAELQAQVARLDELLFKIKASFITVWAAMIGWAFTIKSVRLLPLGFVVIVAFWMFEGMFRGIQARYIERSRWITRFANDRDAVQRAFATRTFPADIVFPLTLSETEWDRLRLWGRGLISPVVATLYLFVALVTYLLWIAVPSID